MNTKCAACGKPLGAEAVEGLCPQCLIRVGLGTRTGATDAGEAGGLGFVPPAITDLAPLFPQLVIVELIGRGGMGAVYKARQKQLDRIVALKILPPGIGNEAAFAERFAREARALARLNHPGIVTIHEFGQVQPGAPDAGAAVQTVGATGGTPVSDPSVRNVQTLTDGMPVPLYYFLMEYVDGVTLRQLLNTGRMSSREALAIVPQICDALQYAHDQGIIHRDIKPENILLDRRGRVKVADFGLAKIVGTESSFGVPPSGGPDRLKPELKTTLTDAGRIMGTPQYMAPEQREHPMEVDHRADIYSLGVVLYQMLTGELPSGKFEPPSRRVQVDVRLDEIVLRALEKKPELRYQQASVLKTQIETVTAGTEEHRSRTVEPVLAWRDRWMWDIRNGYARVAFLLWLLAVVAPGWLMQGGREAAVIWIAVGGGAWVGVMVVYTWVGYRIGQLRSSLPADHGEIAEGWLGWPEGVWPFNRSQGLAILHDDRLELIPVWSSGKRIVPLADIASVRETGWVYMPLFWKRGFVLTLVDGREIMLAVPEPFGRRWRARLSRGRLTEQCDPGGTKPAPGPLPGWVKPARWTARILGALGILIVLPFILAEGLPPLATQPGGVQLTFFGGLLLAVGFIVGWWREGRAALLIAAGWTVIRISESSFQLATPFEAVLLIAALYALCWWAACGRKTERLVTMSAVLVVVLVLGRMFCPTSVFVSGTITDAATGAPVADAELRLLPRLEPGRGPSWTLTGKYNLNPVSEKNRPNARSDKNGRYHLYVGWYDRRIPLRVSATGFADDVTCLGPRALGQRRIQGRDIGLQPEARKLVVEAAPFKARLDAGGIELVALSDFQKCVDPSLGITHHQTAQMTNKLWWQPDGGRFDRQLPVITGGLNIRGRDAFEVAFKISTQPNGTPDVILESIPGSGSYPAGVSSASWARRVEDMVFLQTLSCEPGLERTGFRVGVAAGPWRTIRQMSFESMASGGGGSGSFLLSVVATGKETVVTFNYVQCPGWQARLVAIGPRGLMDPIRNGQMFGVGNNQSVSYVFDSDAIKEAALHFQHRPYEWVEFRNVALKAGARDSGVERKP